MSKLALCSFGGDHCEADPGLPRFPSTNRRTGWSLHCVSAVDSAGRTIWIVDAHGYGKRFIVRADERLTAFMELKGRYTSSP